MMVKTKTKFLTVRMTPAVHKEFLQKTRRLGGPSLVMREMVTAFLENRMQLLPPKQKEIYHVSGSED